MGLVRKTLSVSTLGLIPFRSRKEKLRSARNQRDEAAAALKAVEASLELARQRVAEAELLALKEAGRANKAQRSQTKDVAQRRKQRRARAEGALVAVEERVKPLSRRAKKELINAEKRAGHTREVLDKKVEELSRRARKKVAKTQKKAQKRARKLGRGAESASRDAMKKAREAAVAQVESVQAAVGGS